LAPLLGLARPDGHHHDRRAVGSCALDRLGGDAPDRARPVLDDHGLPERRAHLLGDDPGDDVGRPAGREADEDPDRLVDLVLGKRRHRKRNSRHDRRGDRIAHVHVFLLLVLARRV